MEYRLLKRTRAILIFEDSSPVNRAKLRFRGSANHRRQPYLHRTIPYAASCYYSSPYYDPSACATTKPNYYTNQPRTDVYGAATGLNWESCLSQTCALNARNTSEALSDECYLGCLSSLYVNASEARHVVTAVKFAQAHHLRVTIKNTGHDYFGRSTDLNTLAIWTHNMNTMTYHADFTASNCTASNVQNIGEIGVGAQASDVYTYFQKFNMDLTGGNEGSVGLAGGFGQGGGPDVFSPSYGLMAVNAVKFDVVTADGQFQTINQCNDPELFWTMRGGGGGSFAILTSYRFQLHPAVKINVYSLLQGWFRAAGQRNYQPRCAGTGSHITRNVPARLPSKAEVYLVLLSNDETALKSLSREFSFFLTSQPDILISESNYTTSRIFEAVASRLIPKSLFETDTTVSDLISAVLKRVRLSNKVVTQQGALAQVIMTTPVNHQNGNTTSANPGWRSALWHVIMTGGWTTELPRAEKAVLHESRLDTVEPLKDLAPGGGCFYSECQATFPRTT
ncbi:hypothetical protein BDW59DRAFT_169879 [Aspergillus cavernicola]|uniref:FAD-binding PCMH-type domain-containing protein n=1 Tax=Aspergillus cavernicola TaxID=176166 RepID=A0ABR4ITT3_9EURO